MGFICRVNLAERAEGETLFLSWNVIFVVSGRAALCLVY